MYYQVITQADVKQELLFPTLKEAKRFIVYHYPNHHAVIRHRRDDHTIKITSYYPQFGFETRRVDSYYFQHFCDD